MSTLAVDNITPSAGGTAYILSEGVAKARWSYSQSTNTDQESDNIASFLDEATGQYSANYTNNMSTTFYTVNGTGEDSTGNERVFNILSNGNADGRTTTFAEVGVTNGGNVSVDAITYATVFGDLA